MREAGHIYAMVNPSLPGLVKIGKTTGEPQSRAEELSKATGVATPFFAAFSIEVPDCHTAEQYVHSLLESKGFNRISNREFFEISLSTAVELLIQAKQKLQEEDVRLPSNAQEAASAASEGQDDDPARRHPGAAIFQKALDTYHGWQGEVEDRREAQKLFRRATALNFPPAFVALAGCFESEAIELASGGNLHGEQQFREKAFEILREGARRGHGRCYVELARLYTGSGVKWDPRRDPENATKCWRKYFQSSTFIGDEDRSWDWIIGLGCDGKSRAEHAGQYLFDIFLGLLPLDEENLRILLPIRSEIIEDRRGVVASAEETATKFLEFVNSVFRDLA
jgi:hypothetical protein